MAVYKLKAFARFARDEGIADRSLREAVERVDKGLVDADLGGNLIKQRVARQGQGRSGGYRVLIAYRTQAFSVFLYGFAKRDRDNLDAKELKIVRQLAEAWLKASPEVIERALKDGQLIEVTTW
jgi:hypothetical protein